MLTTAYLHNLPIGTVIGLDDEKAGAVLRAVKFATETTPWLYSSAEDPGRWRWLMDGKELTPESQWWRETEWELIAHPAHEDASIVLNRVQSTIGQFALPANDQQITPETYGTEVKAKIERTLAYVAKAAAEQHRQEQAERTRDYMVVNDRATDIYVSAVSRAIVTEGGALVFIDADGHVVRAFAVDAWARVTIRKGADTP